MIFVDEAKILVKAGDGGKGCESFYRDKYMRHPRPDGGDGGKGGDVKFLSSRSIQTLLDFRYQQHFKADKGGNASSKGKKGRNGKDTVLRVPIGTIIRDYETGLLIKDLAEDKQSVIVAHGGEGGFGNMNNKQVVPPKLGEERIVTLELKLVADVGLIGFPNAGKSTIISAISKVRSKIASYPFTTKQPILGFVERDDFHFVAADLPGIIEGAHEGKGLGHRFLRHAERTKVLVQVIDMAGTDMRDPLEDYEKINRELHRYSDGLMIKNKILVANKMDVPEAQENLKRFQKKYDVEILEISAVEKEGLEALVQKAEKLLCQENSLEK